MSTTTTRVVDVDALDGVMSCDHVIRVHDDGTVSEPPGIYAPELCGDTVDGDGWSLLHGWSGQWNYRGPLMHSSEFIGGNLARHILATPGYWVVVYGEDHWALARREA